jgi:thiamine-monophosphate kinase
MVMSREDDIIARFFAPLAVARPGIESRGLKDDAGTIAPARGQTLVVTTDSLVEGVHFLADDAPEDIAWRALAVNVSDLAAKAAEPLAYVMALQLPARCNDDRWLARFAAGLGNAQSTFGITLLGGDTDRATGGLIIGITAFGQVPMTEIPLRTGAKPGDVLFVSGTIGDAALGLSLRTAPDSGAPWLLDDTDRDRLIKTSLRPTPRLALRSALRRYATASMDVSDGLARDAGKLCAASGVAYTIRLADLPISAAARRVFAIDPAWPLKAATAGDDYEILAAVPPAQAAEFARAANAADTPVTRIAQLSAPNGGSATCRLLDSHGNAMQLTHDGWTHF